MEFELLPSFHLRGQLFFTKLIHTRAGFFVVYTLLHTTSCIRHCSESCRSQDRGALKLNAVRLELSRETGEDLDPILYRVFTHDKNHARV